MKKCENQVLVGVRDDGSEILIPCGKWYMNATIYCDDCLSKLEEKYPQGWSHYAGDTCEHGVYVGGCGRDYMCAECEGY